MNLKDTWKDVGKGLGSAFTDLGKAVIKSAKTGVEIVDEWANSGNQQAGNRPAETKPADLAEGEVAETTETTEAPETTEADNTANEEAESEQAVPEQTVTEKPRFTHDNIDDNDD